MVHDIDEAKGFVALNPLIDIYHIGEVSETQSMSTGQPLLIVCDTLDEALDMAFTEYDKETGEGTPRQIDWIVLDTEIEAQALADVISTFPKVSIEVINHNDKYIIPYADFFLDMLEDSAEKTVLVVALSVYLPHIKTSEELNN